MNAKKSCPKCNKYIDPSNFSRHLISHDGDFKCIHCSQSYNRRDNLRRHLKFHGDDISQAIQSSASFQQPSVILPEPSEIS